MFVKVIGRNMRVRFFGVTVYIIIRLHLTTIGL